MNTNTTQNITPVWRLARDAGLYVRMTGGGIDFPARAEGIDVECVIMSRSSPSRFDLESPYQDDSADDAGAIVRMSDGWNTSEILFEGTLGECIKRLGSMEWQALLDMPALDYESCL